MEMSLGSRLKHAWNVFKANEIIKPRWDIGPSYHYRPDRPIFSRGNERSIITSVYNRIALDVAAITSNMFAWMMKAALLLLWTAA